MVEMFAMQCLLVGDERRDNRKANAHEGPSVRLNLFPCKMIPTNRPNLLRRMVNTSRVFYEYSKSTFERMNGEEKEELLAIAVAHEFLSS